MPGAEQQTLPILRGPIDTLRDGSVAFKQSVLTAHPVETVQEQHVKNEWQSSLYITERVYGSHAAWEKRMDRAVLSQVQRLPGLPSSHVGLDALLGKDQKLEWEDVLNVPELRPSMPKLSVHDLMENKLKLK